MSNLKYQRTKYSLRANIKMAKEYEDVTSFHLQIRGRQIFFKLFLKESGGGCFDLNGLKQGQLVELHAYFTFDPIQNPYFKSGWRTFFEGKYKNGKRYSNIQDQFQKLNRKLSQYNNELRQ
ncbi:unnamed protein product [Paramecium sonneborni]|uniref:Uncharacterized protein n=1 Tax=Paramecium sonneborni TaxID=65129 RepID=A0A8S1RQY1_9CILI|nr:unnamed protein product [Paramecium sonneborni]